MAKKASEYRAIYGLRQGHLHKALGVNPGEGISDEKLEAASKSSNEHVKQMAAMHKAHNKSKK